MKKGEIPLQFLDPRPQLEQYSSEGKKTGWGSAADFPLPHAVLYTPLPPPPLPPRLELAAGWQTPSYPYKLFNVIMKLNTVVGK